MEIISFHQPVPNSEILTGFSSARIAAAPAALPVVRRENAVLPHPSRTAHGTSLLKRVNSGCPRRGSLIVLVLRHGDEFSGVLNASQGSDEDVMAFGAELQLPSSRQIIERTSKFIVFLG
jgi:hypothetical protein